MASTAGVGGNNSMYVTFEDPYGTYIDPADGDGVWMPFVEESLVYTENKYYSQQIRKQTIDSEVKPAFYHVEGDIKMEVDCNYMPYFLYASRNSVGKAGPASLVYTYTATPGTFGSTYPGGTANGLSITIIRNGEGFGYAGCVAPQAVYSIEDGVAMVTFSIIGLSEEEPADLDTASFIAPSIFGADAHTIFVDDSGTAPAFGAGGDNTFNGFTATFNDNGAAQNRIRPERKATFISYGKTEYSYNTELDFLDRTEYDKMVSSTTRALKYQSIKPGGAGTWAAATQGIRITMRRNNYDTYVVNTPAIGDLIMAQVTGHGLAQTGAAAYTIECKSLANIVAPL